MKSLKKITPHMLIFWGILFLLYIQMRLNKKIIIPKITISKQQASYNFNTTFIQLFSLEYKRLFSSLLWVQTMMESDIEHYKQKDSNSWMHLRFQTITNLDPKFYKSYLYGGQYLSIIKDDIIGAKIIYEKGLKIFPNDFSLNFNAGFNYYFELGDCEKAYEKYSKITSHPETKKNYKFLPALTARLKACSTDIASAFTLLRVAYERAPKGSSLKKKIFSSLYSIKAELDLACLNSKNENCNTKDLTGENYLKKSNEIYYAQKKWKPYNSKIKQRR